MSELSKIVELMVQNLSLNKDAIDTMKKITRTVDAAHGEIIKLTALTELLHENSQREREFATLQENNRHAEKLQRIKGFWGGFWKAVGIGLTVTGTAIGGLYMLLQKIYGITC